MVCLLLGHSLTSAAQSGSAAKQSGTVPQPAGKSAGQLTAQPPVPAEAEHIYDYVEQMPEYPGGTGEMLKFLSANVQYPELARTHSIEGKVYVRFVVDTSGSVTQVLVQKGLGGGCDEEAVRVVKLLAGFKPGKQNGRPVPVYYLVPLAFRLK